MKRGRRRATSSRTPPPPSPRVRTATSCRPVRAPANSQHRVRVVDQAIRERSLTPVDGQGCTSHARVGLARPLHKVFHTGALLEHY
eukprot:365347-Chlamydomonas_euryale.AAC.30